MLVLAGLAPLPDTVQDQVNATLDHGFDGIIVHVDEPGKRYQYSNTNYLFISEFIHKDIDTVVVRFANTTDFDGYNWNLSQIICNRIVKIVRRDKRP